jgi:hypothetical protein
MATRKLEFSLRLRHDKDDLSAVTQALGLVARVGWNKGEQNKTIAGELSDGTRDVSYRSFPLGIGASNDLDDAISECLKKLAPLSAVLQSFVSSGGMASLAIAWFCDSDVGGDRIPAELIAEMARLKLTLDLYLYLSPESNAVVSPTI